MSKLIEHHELESSRLRGNIDFWKEKVDGLIKSQKEMLEHKTKLHLELEQKENHLRLQAAQIRQLSDEMESFQRQLNRQKYLQNPLNESSGSNNDTRTTQQPFNIGSGLIQRQNSRVSDSVYHKLGQPKKQTTYPYTKKSTAAGLAVREPNIIFENIEHSQTFDHSNNKIANKYEHSQSPAKQAAKRVVNKKGQ